MTAETSNARGLVDYDAGLLNDFGGGDVNWWQDYLRAEIERANVFWREQTEQALAAEGVHCDSCNGSGVREVEQPVRRRIVELANQLVPHAKELDCADLFTIRAHLIAAAHSSPLSQQPEARGVGDARLASKARELQRKYYGDGAGLHLEMIDWAREFDALTGDRNG